MEFLNKSTEKYPIYWLRTCRIIFIFAIFGGISLAALPSSNISIFQLNDKVMHFLAFFLYGLGFSLFYQLKRPIWLKSIFVSLSVGGVIEVMQYFIPWRSSEWLDLFADLIGGVLSIPVAYSIAKLPVYQNIRNGSIRCFAK
jgi:VanZ family protein